MAGSRYLVGIDLGTTNTACAYVDTQRGRTIEVFDIPQLTGVGRAEPRPTLPSFVYLAGAHELPAGALDLPWAAGRDFAVGVFAREQGSKVPGRLVTSSKSWLCHGGVDRTAAILPWGAADDVARISPVDASARVLRHVADAIDLPDLPADLLPEAAPKAWRKRRVVLGRILSGDQFINSEEVRVRLHRDFDAQAVEMEGAAVAQVGALLGLPVVVVRCLSDLAGADSHLDFPRFVKAVAPGAAMVLRQIIREL